MPTLGRFTGKTDNQRFVKFSFLCFTLPNLIVSQRVNDVKPIDHITKKMATCTFYLHALQASRVND